MNYLAYCAEGKGYTCLSDNLIDEMTNRTPLYEQPHFKDVLGGRAPQRDGIWNYQKRAATRKQSCRRESRLMTDKARNSRVIRKRQDDNASPRLKRRLYDKGHQRIEYFEKEFFR